MHEKAPLMIETQKEDVMINKKKKKKKYQQLFFFFFFPICTHSWREHFDWKSQCSYLNSFGPKIQKKKKVNENHGIKRDGI
jgi:hypothetical protein